MYILHERRKMSCVVEVHSSSIESVLSLIYCN